ncbi:ATP-binding protein [Bradyrhizobium sp. UFLA05-109]
MWKLLSPILAKRTASILALVHIGSVASDAQGARAAAVLSKSLHKYYRPETARATEYYGPMRKSCYARAETVNPSTRLMVEASAILTWRQPRRFPERLRRNCLCDPKPVSCARNLGNAVETSIRDNGASISLRCEKDVQPLLHRRADGKERELGLSMTHEIVVKQHGGRIDVATEPGDFTEFIIILLRGNP